MKMEIVRLYISPIDRLTGGYCYVKQWGEWHNPIDNLNVGYRDYPIPLSWRRIFARRHAVQSGMFEALWKVLEEGAEVKKGQASFAPILDSLAGESDPD